MQKKASKGLETELVNLEVKLSEIDDEGTFEGYAAVFGNVDNRYDLLQKGAFIKSLSAKQPSQIKLLYQHDQYRPIGVVQELKEDSKGLWMKAKLNINTTLGAEVKSNLKEKVLDSLSIGYQATEFEFKEINKRLVRVLKAVELWEVSVVTFPANPKAIIRSVKNAEHTKSVSVECEILKHMANFIKERM